MKPSKTCKCKRPQVSTYYMKYQKENMWTAMRVKPDGTEEELNVMDLYHIAENALLSSILTDNGR
jgi:hypothetical protein